MNDRTRKLLLACALALFAALTACKTDYIQPPASAHNPPPAYKFSEFEYVELAPMTISPPYHEHEKNQAATVKINENLVANLAPLFSIWNGESGTATRGTLVIEPVVTQIKFISGGARFAAGAMAGSSAVVMVVTMKDKDTGEIIAQPEFFQRAQAMAGAYTMGAHDNLMLTRVAKLVSDYIQANFAEAVGGPTGLPEN